MTSSKRILCAALAAALLLPALAAPAAEAGIGGGIGITFPTSHSSGKEGRTATYAGVRVGDLSQELTLREKDGQLQLKLRVRNEGDALYMVEHPTGQNCDFALLDAKGNELWRWSDGMAFTQAFQTYALEPGTAEELTAEIDRKTYQKIKDKAMLAVAGLTDTGIFVSAEVPAAGRGKRSPAYIHGDIIFGSGGWTRW